MCPDRTNDGQVTYGYDGNGQRVTKTVGGQTTTYVYDAFGNLAAEYGGLAPSVTGTLYLTQDHLGSTRLLTDGQGTVKERHDYMPFGDELFAGTGARTTGQGYLNVGSAEAVNTLFTGQYRDTELASSAMPSGLDYFVARHMAAGLGRFLSPDPDNAGADPGYPQTWHRYGYVANNPIVNIDPYGLFCPASGCEPPPGSRVQGSCACHHLRPRCRHRRSVLTLQRQSRSQAFAAPTMLIPFWGP